MRRLSPEEVGATVELQQLIAHYWEELDGNLGRNVEAFWHEDGVFTAGSQVDCRGVAAIKKFYADRNERVLSDEKDGVRTSRHTSTDMRVTFHGTERATLNLRVINYSAGGKPPIMGAAAPSIVSDLQIEVRRDAAGEWRMSEFHGRPVFVGGDPFQNQTLLGTPASPA
jgi:hypothetical protein